jgi:hypothetical protein
MSEKEIKDYENWEFDPYVIFEWDPDYMIDGNGWYVYFCRIWNKVYYIDSEYGSENLEKLEQFIENQNPKISLGWYTSRIETKNRLYLDDDESFYDYKWLKIAYRWWAWYTYTCFKYID